MCYYVVYFQIRGFEMLNKVNESKLIAVIALNKSYSKCDQVLARVKLAGNHGLTVRNLKRLMPLRKMKQREADEILNHLVELGYVEIEKINEGAKCRPSYLIKHMDYV